MVHPTQAAVVVELDHKTQLASTAQAAMVVLEL
jgi:hypothetical protein